MEQQKDDLYSRGPFAYSISPNKLPEFFNKTILAVVLYTTEPPMFYRAPFGIRFEISGPEDTYLDSPSNKLTMNPLYVNNALKRAEGIYSELPHPPDILRIDFYVVGNQKKPQKNFSPEQFKKLGLPQPHYEEEKICYSKTKLIYYCNYTGILQ